MSNTPSWLPPSSVFETPLWVDAESEHALPSAWRQLFGEQYDPTTAMDSYADASPFGGRGHVRLFSKGRIAIEVPGWGAFIVRLPEEVRCQCGGHTQGALPFRPGHSDWCAVRPY